MLSRQGGLKFSGRTSTLGGAEDVSPASRRGHILRACCLGAAILLLLLCAVVAARRESVGNLVPWPASRPLRIFDSSVAASSSSTASTWARARLVGDGRSWGETLGALPTLLGEWAQRLAPPEVGASGAAWAIGLLWLGLVLWWLAALMLGTRRPSLGLGLLILAQGFGAAYWLGSRRAPIRRIETASTCRAFDLGARARISGAALSVPESIEWHRARGFSGLAFAGADRSPSPSGLLVLSGLDLQAHDGTQRLLLLPESPILLSLYSNARTIWQQAGGAGALAIAPAPWRASGPPTNRELLSVQSIPAQAVEAWSGRVGDESLARQSRARGLPVVGSSGAGVGSDCFVWTLLPSDVRTPSDVILALKQRRVAVAHALLPDETPANLKARRLEAQSPSIILKTWRQAMSALSPAQKLNARLQVLALLLALLWWGARSAELVEAPSGPQTAMKFLKRKRLPRRLGGLALMTLAFAASALAASAWATSWATSLAGAWSVLWVLAAWLALDALYLYGRSVWKRAH